MSETHEHEAAPIAGLDTDLGWLLARTVRALAQIREVTLAGFPGGPRGYLVLRGAAAKGGADKAHKQIALARRLGIDRTVMVYLIDDLVKADLVERRPDPSDRRNRLIVVTETGRKLLGAVTAELESRDKVLLAPLSAEERDVLREMLHRVAGHAAGADFATGEACETADEIIADGSC